MAEKESERMHELREICRKFIEELNDFLDIFEEELKALQTLRDQFLSTRDDLAPNVRRFMQHLAEDSVSQTKENEPC